MTKQSCGTCGHKWEGRDVELCPNCWGMETRYKAEQENDPQIGDWVQDWSGNIFLWRDKHANELKKYPVTRKYLSQIRRADGTVWLREGRSPITGAQLKSDVGGLTEKGRQQQC